MCIDGLPTEDMEVSVHANLSRTQFDGKERRDNEQDKGRGAARAEQHSPEGEEVLKEVKKSEIDWSWLNGIITVDKPRRPARGEKDKTAAFLEELVAGRPILAYPKHIGGFRLRYGRAGSTGIAAKGFSPATMRY